MSINNQDFEGVRGRPAKTGKIARNSARDEEVEDPAKRRTLKIIQAALVGTGALYVASKIPQPIKALSTTQVTPTADLQQTDQTTEVPVDQPIVKENPDSGFNRINEMVTFPLGSTKRLLQENEYVDWAQTLEQIDNGFLGVFDVKLRGKLLDKRFALREKGDPNLRKLSDDDRKWALDNGFHPDSLAICIDSYNEALGILKSKFRELGGKKFYQVFRPDLVHQAKVGKFSQRELDQMMADENSVETLLMNPGGMLYLASRETGMNLAPGGLGYNFVNLGSSSAAEMLTKFYKDRGEPETAVKLISDLEDICKILSENGPINYVSSFLAGSDLSGDIGSNQFRPDTLKAEINFFKENFGILFNPYSLKAPTLAFLFLARGLTIKNNKGEVIDYRYGYLKDSKYEADPEKKNRKEFRRKALIKWNETLQEKILQWANKYYDEVIYPRSLPKRVAFKTLWRRLSQKAA